LFYNYSDDENQQKMTQEGSFLDHENIPFILAFPKFKRNLLLDKTLDFS